VVIGAVTEEEPQRATEVVAPSSLGEHHREVDRVGDLEPEQVRVELDVATRIDDVDPEVAEPTDLERALEEHPADVERGMQVGHAIDLQQLEVVGTIFCKAERDKVRG
jgi:hypothetical protein